MILVYWEGVEVVQLEEIRMDRSVDGVNKMLRTHSWPVSRFINEAQHTALKFSL